MFFPQFLVYPLEFQRLLLFTLESFTDILKRGGGATFFFLEKPNTTNSVSNVEKTSDNDHVTEGWSHQNLVVLRNSKMVRSTEVKVDHRMVSGNT